MVIERKRYMGDRELRSFTVPEDVAEIGDWAFAGCKALTKVELPEGLERIGREVFASCDRLDTVIFYGKSGERETAFGGLAALAFRFFPGAQRFLDLWKKGREEWLTAWDEACRKYLEKPDGEGFLPFWAGGEEDYEEDETKQEEYCREKRLLKAQMACERLSLAPDIAQGRNGENHRTYYEQKLRENDMALEYLLNAHLRPDVAMRVYEETGILTSANIKWLLERLPEEKVEMRAWLLRKSTAGDVFEGLRL